MPLIRTQGGRVRQISKFKASLVYRVLNSAARATQRNPSQTKIKKKKKKTGKRKKLSYNS